MTDPASSPSTSPQAAGAQRSAARAAVADRLDVRRRLRAADWPLWGGVALLVASMVLFAWQPTDVYATVNVCSWCYLGWTSGVGVTGGWGIGSLGALIGWSMVAASLVFATWRPDREAPSWLRLVPVGVMVAGVLVLVINLGEVLATAFGLLTLHLTLGVPAWIAGIALLTTWFRRNDGDLSALGRLRNLRR